ncbi:hypothetical protein C7T35_29775 [Variovorax sp. WS11]|jgi:hypothetical protein|nr:hypothetical protein [Variovorax sp. WS11]PSL80884.1 hypothetical protein C7T35_29775 [Variovorax sp. WS11]
MVGVCMTVLSIGRLRRNGRSGVLIDKLLAFDALVFLASAVLSFASIRSRHQGPRHERRAELLFLAGLAILALGAVALAFVIE